MASVEIRDVRKSYGAAPVLHGVSFDIRDGEFVILVGPSGCGKSTLLRMIAGLEDITGGEISIGSRVVNDLAPKQRDIAMVFQNYALYPHMTVADNMGFSLRLAGRNRAEIATTVNRAAVILGLDSLLDRYPRQLSGGQRQRVAMGRAIVRDPQVFLFDEPLSNLDAKLRVQMRTEIKALHQRLGTTMIYVTHDQIEAMTMADRIVVMRDGVIEQIGDPLELYDRPANLFVAGFIGSPAMNLIPGRLDATGFLAESGMRLPLAEVPGAAQNRAAFYGVRPEHFAIAPDGMPVEVVVIEPTGSETQVVGKAGDSQIIAVFRERVRARPGDTLLLKPDPDLVHLFDRQTGERIGNGGPKAPSPSDRASATERQPEKTFTARPREPEAPQSTLRERLGSLVTGGYDPGKHYMRGPGPKTLARMPRTEPTESGADTNGLVTPGSRVG